jgi:hypothetical protein
MVFTSLVWCLLSGSVAWADPGPRDDVPTGPPPARWFKGNLHTHTLWSDGNEFPEMVAEWYRDHGYNFLAISDHDILIQGSKWVSVEESNRRARADVLARYKARFGEDWVETRELDGVEQVRLKPLGEIRALFDEVGKFLLIQGEEITDQFERKPLHVNAANIIERVPPQGGRNAVEAMTKNLDAIGAQGRRLGRATLGMVNHPNFGYAINAEDLALATKGRFVEVYNGHPLTRGRGDGTHPPVERLWDIVNTLRLGELKALPIYGLATDDAHNYTDRRGPSPGRGWIMVRSRYLTPEALIRALNAGDFYGSSGVTLKRLDFDRASQTLSLEVDPLPETDYHIEFIGTPRDYDRSRRPVLSSEGRPLPVTSRYSSDVGQVLARSEGLTASYQLTGDELYVRAVVTASRPPENPSYPAQRQQAWTQPIGWERD